MHILYHHRTMGRGAEGAHIANMVLAFKALGHSVTVVSPPGVDPLSEIGKTPLDKSAEKVRGVTRLWRLVSTKFPQIIFEIMEICYNLTAINKISKIIAQQQIDFIYERSAFFLFAGAYIAHQKKIPLVIEANEAVGIQRARKLIMKKIAGAIEQYSSNRALVTFTVSSFLAKLLRNNSRPGTTIIVTPNCIDPATFTRSTKRTEIRARYKISNKIVLGFAGWFDWWDRLDLLIDAQKNLLTKGHANIATILIGDGPITTELKEKIHSLNLAEHIMLTGAVSKQEVIDYLDCIDIGVLPHSNDFGSPMIMFELMALGKCIIAPELAPIKDVISDGENGILFKPLDKIQFTKKIESAITDESFRKQIGLNAKKMIFSKYTWERNAENVISLIKSRHISST